MPKIDKESDTLEREYRHLSDKLERLHNTKYLSKDYTPDQIQTQIDLTFQRQSEIVKELEECTGVKIHRKTMEETLQEIEDIHKLMLDGKITLEEAQKRARQI